MPGQYGSLVVHADSIGAGSHLPNPLVDRYPAKLALALGGIPEINTADGGDNTADQARKAFARARLANELTILGTIHNDLNWYAGSLAAAKRFLCVEGHLAALLHCATPDASPNKTRARAMTAGAGSWTNLVDAQDVGGCWTRSPGGERSCQKAGSTIVATLLGYDNEGGEATVTIDGTPYGPFPLNNQVLSGGGTILTGEGHDMTPLPLIFDGLEDRMHDVTIKKTDSSESLVAISQVLGFNNTPIAGGTVLVGNSFNRTDACWQASNGAQQRAPLYNRAWARNVAIANRLGLTGVRLWDLSPVVNPATDTIDGLHLHAECHTKLKDNAMAVLASPARPLPADILLAASISRAGFGPRPGSTLRFVDEQIRAVFS